MRVVVDTSTLISVLLNGRGTVGHAFRHVRDHGKLIHSDETLAELRRKLSMSKFDAYATRAERERFADLLEMLPERIADVQPATGCRDPNDDMFLALAVSGSAGLITSSDRDLLTLGSFRGIEILSPSVYVQRFRPK